MLYLRGFFVVIMCRNFGKDGWRIKVINNLIFFQAQFTLMILHYSQVLLPWCYDEKLIVFAYIFVPNVLVYFYLFYDFYKKAYNSKANLKMSKSKSH